MWINIGAFVFKNLDARLNICRIKLGAFRAKFKLRKRGMNLLSWCNCCLLFAILAPRNIGDTL